MPVSVVVKVLVSVFVEKYVEMTLVKSDFTVVVNAIVLFVEVKVLLISHCPRKKA